MDALKQSRVFWFVMGLGGGMGLMLFIVLNSFSFFVIVLFLGMGFTFCVCAGGIILEFKDPAYPPWFRKSKQREDNAAKEEGKLDG